MLVLTRKEDQVIVIGGNITITVVEIRGDKVRLGIDAPREVTVHRKEVQERIEKGAKP
jgi:carbon storage regulator